MAAGQLITRIPAVVGRLYPHPAAEELFRIKMTHGAIAAPAIPARKTMVLIHKSRNYGSVRVIPADIVVPRSSTIHGII